MTHKVKLIALVLIIGSFSAYGMGQTEGVFSKAFGAPAELNANLGFIAGSGLSSLGVEGNLGVEVYKNSNIRLLVGGLLGFYIRFSPSGVLIPIAPAAWVKFKEWGKGWTPKVGTSIGLVIGSGVAFWWMAEPGIEYNAPTSDWTFNFVPRLGIIGSGFVFAPQAGVTLNM